MHDYLTPHMAGVYLHIVIMMIVISVMTAYTEKHLLDSVLL